MFIKGTHHYGSPQQVFNPSADSIYCSASHSAKLKSFESYFLFIFLCILQKATVFTDSGFSILQTKSLTFQFCMFLIVELRPIIECKQLRFARVLGQTIEAVAQPHSRQKAARTVTDILLMQVTNQFRNDKRVFFMTLLFLFT